MIRRFNINTYCEAQQPDNQWYRGNIQGGPYYTKNDGRPYYKVHLHHPLNKHEMIWATQLRPDPNDYGDGSSKDPSSSASYDSSAPPLNTTTSNQFAASSNQFVGSKTGATGVVTLQATSPLYNLPLKRSLDVGQQPVTSIVDVEAAQSALLDPNVGIAAGTLAVQPAAAAVVTGPAAQTSRDDAGGPSLAHQRSLLALLEGPVIEVRVTQSNSQDLSVETKTWGLPKALLAHSSLFFRVATRNVTDAHNKKSINLPGFQPAVFEAFLEWMYWGSYNAPAGVSDLEHGHDIDAWILGDKLEAAGFQNVAMDRLYLQYTASDSLQPLTIETVTYICARTATGSPLRLFLLDVLAQNFTNTERVKGTLEDWDVALQEYPDARLLLLAGFRTYGSSGSSVKAKKNYLVNSRKHT
ncbi:hypothetical protein EKO04_004763 [Ascochyta lentis]|uniref:BTB domain-containing protein n=1 Tax=Ascochyta lentis TaxID=205686 RepID=A0A8H7J7V2_9PLEO|nr:hypothetical protein EKO04_004763 [Ascochyta lentis]